MSLPASDLHRGGHTATGKHFDGNSTLSLFLVLFREDLGSLLLLSDPWLASNGRYFSDAYYVTRFTILNLASNPHHPYFTDE